MSMNSTGRPSSPEKISDNKAKNIDNNKAAALLPDEPLLFEIGNSEICGVDLPDINIDNSYLGGFERKSKIELPALSEPETMRHYVRLSRLNMSIDSGIYPLGSCTMKHNPRLNEQMARLDGFMNIHPLQPINTIKGALELMEELANWLINLTNMHSIALSPKAGAHGELCGMMAIKAAHKERGEQYRNIVLVPESAHGTNPATAAFLGYKVKPIKANKNGTIDVKEVISLLDDNIAAIMLTNPNTCGLFEPDIIEIAQAIHNIGAYLYCDGANYNAIMGIARPGDLGIDAMHINLHKTFSTPHGGGGPGAGPVLFSKDLTPFAPIPFIKRDKNELTLIEHIDNNKSFGRLTAFHGQFGMFVRSLSYILSHGIDGITQAAKDAVLNANYVKARLEGEFSAPFGAQHTMHEILFDDDFLKGTGISTLDFAKAMIDEGFHPMTMYFPLIVHGAMLIEPTESESKYSLDYFCDKMLELAKEAKAGNIERFINAPLLAPRFRIDETLAARKPKLKWEGKEN